jgi:hypothetical protein
MSKLATELLELLESLAAEQASTLVEDKGNLKDIPDAWMKIVSKGNSALGGKDSEIKDFGPVKNVSKWRTGIIDGMKADGLVAIYVTVDDSPFALIYKKSNWSNSRPEYSIVSVEGEVEKIQKSSVRQERSMVKSTYTNRWRTQYNRKAHWYEQEGMPMSTLLIRLQGSIAKATQEEGADSTESFDSVFKRASVQLHGITVDATRMDKRKERSANKPSDTKSAAGMKDVLQAADKKYLKKKSAEVAGKLQKEMIEAIDGLKDRIASMLDDAAEGKKPTNKMINDEMALLKNKIDQVSILADAIAQCVNQKGEAELYRRWSSMPEKSYDFKRLVELIKASSAKEEK